MSLLYPGASAAEVARFVELQSQVFALQQQYDAIKDYRDYYLGNHPVFLSDRQKEYLGDITKATHTITLNLTRVVIDVLRERISVIGIKPEKEGDSTVPDMLWEWWQNADMISNQITLHRRTLRDIKAYMITDWDEDLEQPVWYPNHCYDGDTGVTFHRDDRNRPILANKYWRVGDPSSKHFNKLRKTVYMPDRILFYQEGKGQDTWLPIPPEEGDPIQWWTSTMTEDGDPLGLAVAEFINPANSSEIEQIIGLQNMLNKMLLDLSAAADATGFNIMTISYQGSPMGSDTSDKEDDALKIAPGRAIELYEGAVAGSIAAGDLSQLLGSINAVISYIAGGTRTPHYYLRPFGGAEVPSGESLKQLESGLVSKAEERTQVFTGSWKQCFTTGIKLYNAMTGNSLDHRAHYSLIWRDPQVRNELFMAQVALEEAALGIPQEALWVERLGRSPQQAEKYKEANEEEQRKRLTSVLGGLDLGKFSRTTTSVAGARKTGVAEEGGESARPALGGQFVKFADKI